MPFIFIDGMLPWKAGHDDFQLMAADCADFPLMAHSLGTRTVHSFEVWHAELVANSYVFGTGNKGRVS